MHVQTYMANKTFAQKIRENKSNFWKRAPTWKCNKNNAQIRKHSPMLTYFNRFETKIHLGHFFEASEMHKNLKMGPKHQAALKPT